MVPHSKASRSVLSPPRARVETPPRPARGADRQTAPGRGCKHLLRATAPPPRTIRRSRRGRTAAAWSTEPLPALSIAQPVKAIRTTGRTAAARRRNDEDLARLHVAAVTAIAAQGDTESLIDSADPESLRVLDDREAGIGQQARRLLRLAEGIGRRLERPPGGSSARRVRGTPRRRLAVGGGTRPPVGALQNEHFGRGNSALHGPRVRSLKSPE